MSQNNDTLIINLLAKYNISPTNLQTYQKAFTHRSLNSKTGMNYERLEFLGDAVIKLILTEKLLELYPNEPEGVLSKKRAMYVQDKLLSKISKEIELNKIILCGKNEKDNQLSENYSVLADLLESLTAAIYMDKGFQTAKNFIYELFKDVFSSSVLTKELRDNKTILQEITQDFTPKLPKYETLKETGPDHKKMFTVKVSIALNNKDYSATSTDSTKKLAEQKAAQLLIKKIKDTK